MPSVETLTALTGLEEGVIRYQEKISVHHLGQDIVRVIGYDEEDIALTEVSEGYHINTSSVIEELSEYQVFPTNPITKWAGDESL